MGKRCARRAVAALIFLGAGVWLWLGRTSNPLGPESQSSGPEAFSPDAPWPSMRGNHRNTGRLAGLSWEGGSASLQAPVHFRTGNGVFSTPVLDADDRIYVGSADHFFRAWDPMAGKELWHADLGEVIDSAACIGRAGALYVGSGSGKIHAFSRDGKALWTFDVLRQRPKARFTLSTNWWFEGNVVLGPDGALYAGGDDFFLYKLSQEGHLLWSFRTGFLIWAAPAFGPDGSVYLAGFDMILYALDGQTGRVRWKTRLGNALISSPAVAQDGTIYQGCLDGKMVAVRGATGQILWSFTTQGHLYASPAVAPEGTLYFGSTDGAFYAVDPGGRLLWDLYTGDAIRSSASIGPDPEWKSPYLVYFAGGDGQVTAVDPQGQIRWSYDTLTQARMQDYPNINASVAMGRTGLAVGSASGDVIWIPYDSFLQEGLPGMKVGGVTQGQREGLFWHRVSPGGHLDQIPLDGRTGILDGGEILSLRLLSYSPSGAKPLRLAPGSVIASWNPPLGCEVRVQSDRSTVHIIPSEILSPGTDYGLTIRARGESASSPWGKVRWDLSFRTQESSVQDAMPVQVGQRFEITHMAVPLPAIIPSLDQIGIASLTLPFTIVSMDPASGAFVAWGVQRFGDKGVPDPRINFYAFSGRTRGDAFVMESRNGLFEITAFPMAMDLFRVAGRVLPGGSGIEDGSLLIEKNLGRRSPGQAIQFRDGGPSNPKRIAAALWRGGVTQFTKASLPFMSTYRAMSRGRIWDDWGLLNSDGTLVGVGTCRGQPLSGPDQGASPPVRVLAFRYRSLPRAIVADLDVTGSATSPAPAIGIVAVARSTGQALPLNYTRAMRYKNLSKGRLRVILCLPQAAPTSPGRMRATLMADLAPVAQLEF